MLLGNTDLASELRLAKSKFDTAFVNFVTYMYWFYIYFHINMLSGFLRNLGGGNVSGLNIAGLIAAAYLVFGRSGWLGKIAGLFLGMMLIGNNAGVVRTVPSETVSRTQTPTLSPEEQAQSGGMRR